jgi:hypothetical protein
MIAADHVEQWVCLLRVGEFGVDTENWVVTQETITSIAANFREWRPVAISVTAAMGPPAESKPELPPFSGAEIVAVEVREDDRGAYLAGLFRTPDVCIAITKNGRDSKTGALFGPCLMDVMFTREKLQPFEPVSPTAMPNKT